jgi:hypothetical protein
LRERQHWQAFEARLLTLFVGRMPLGLRPASVEDRLFGADVLVGWGKSAVSEGDEEVSDMESGMVVEVIGREV